MRAYAMALRWHNRKHELTRGSDMLASIPPERAGTEFRARPISIADFQTMRW